MAKKRLKLGPDKTNIYVNFLPAISTITYFSGTPPIEYIKQKLIEIIKLNPWLVGRLVWTWNDGIIVEYDNGQQNINIDDYFVMIEHDHLIIPQTYDNSFALKDPNISKYSVNRGLLCLYRPNEVLFRVILITQSQNEKNTSSHPIFAMVISLSHTISDGYTYYTIYNMLSQDTPAKAMIVERVSTFLPTLKTLPEIWLPSILVIISTCLFILFHPRLCQPVSGFIIISDSKINQIKSTYLMECKTQNIEYISTNDIVVFGYSKITKCDIMLMAVNFRNRIQNITDNHAGNYQSTILLTKSELESPVRPRKALISILNNITHPTKERTEPSIWKKVASRLGLITNWSTFHRDIQLYGCKPELHLPMMSVQFAAIETAIIFRSKGKELVVWTNTRSNVITRDYQQYKDWLS